MSAPQSYANLVLWAIGPVFLLTAAWLTFASPGPNIPVTPMRLTPLDDLKPGAWRTPLSDARKGEVGGIARPCSDCHKLFAAPPSETRTLMQHKDVVLNHGMNARCLNCHAGADRDKLVLHDGTLVDFDQTPRLCSNCHGTTYRDWQRGMHGKTMGSWDASSGKQVRLTCNQCHDPHSPAYEAMKPLPGPRTPRMGDQSRDAEHQHRRSPLRQWSQPSPGSREHDAVPATVPKTGPGAGSTSGPAQPGPEQDSGHPEQNEHQDETSPEKSPAEKEHGP